MWVYGHSWHFNDDVLAGLLKGQIPQTGSFLEDVFLWSGPSQGFYLVGQFVALLGLGGSRERRGHGDWEARGAGREFLLNKITHIQICCSNYFTLSFDHFPQITALF